MSILLKVSSRHGVPVGAIVGPGHSPAITAAQAEAVYRLSQCDGVTLDTVATVFGRSRGWASRKVKQFEASMEKA